MHKALRVVAAAVVGAVAQGAFFLMATNVYYHSLPRLAEVNPLAGLGESICAFAGGLLGALGGAIAAGFHGRASWWIPVLMAAMLGAYVAATEIQRAQHPALALAALTVAGGVAGWIVARLGKMVSGRASDQTPDSRRGR